MRHRMAELITFQLAAGWDVLNAGSVGIKCGGARHAVQRIGVAGFV